MTPMEISGMLGAAIVAGGSLVMLFNKFLGGKKDSKYFMEMVLEHTKFQEEHTKFQVEQIKLLREIRDLLIALGHETKAQKEFQRDRFDAIQTSLGGRH